VGEGEEAGFVGGGGEVDALVEAGPEELFEDVEILGHDVIDVEDVAVDEVEAEHGADAVDAVGDAFFDEQAAQAILKVFAQGVELRIAVAFFEFAELGEADDHGEGVSAEGAGLIDGAVGGELVHDVGAAAEGSDGEASADDLAHGGEVGGEGFEFLDAALGEAEAGHDLVEDEEGAVFGGEVAEELEVSGLGEDEAGVGGVGLDDDGGDLVSHGGEGFLETFDVVVGEDDGFVGEGFGDAGRVWFAAGEGPGASGDEEGVDVAVVAAVELDDLVAFGEAAGQADAGHGGLGAGVDHADFLDAGDPGGDELGHFHLVGIGDAEGEAVFGGFVDGVGEDGGGVAENVGAPAADVVDVGFAIDILDAAAFGAADEEGVAIDIAEGADGGVDAAGDEGLGFGEEGGGDLGVGDGWVHEGCGRGVRREER